MQQSGTRHNRFVDAAFSRLLDSNLSAKYALTGYLGMIIISLMLNLR